MAKGKAPKVGEAAPAVASMLGCVLIDKAAGQIGFVIDGISLTGGDLSDVADALVAGRIAIHVWKHASVSLARYENGPNRLVVPRRFRNVQELSLRDSGLVVHEGVHAAFDLRSQKLQKLMDEACAYVAQLVYCKLWKVYGFKGSVALAAADVADYILSQPKAKAPGGVVVPETILSPLKEAIKADPLYADWADQMNYNGIPAARAPEPAARPAHRPTPVGHPKQSHHSKAFKHGAVSPSHADVFRTPGVYGVA
jgi:hypothetical protein